MEILFGALGFVAISGFLWAATKTEEAQWGLRADRRRTAPPEAPVNYWYHHDGS